MKKSKSTKILFSFLGLATFISLVGTVSGTLAWYSYNTRATLSYSGTSVSNTVALQVGIVSPDAMPSASAIDSNHSWNQNEKKTLKSFWDVMHLEQFADDENYYYFAPAGKGLQSSVINAYLLAHGFATNELPAITSGSYKRGEALQLMNGPKADHPEIDSIADSDCYAKIPFVFRVLNTRTTSSDPEQLYLPNKEVWLYSAKLVSANSSNGSLQKAIRIFVDRENDLGDDYILNPSADVKGETTVAGLLDLSHDGYYDYSLNRDTQQYDEIIYGDYDKDGSSAILPSYSGPDEIDDINHTGKEGDNFDTFTAKHRRGVNYYHSSTGYGYTLKTAQYESMSSIHPKENVFTEELSNYDESKPSSVCKTADATGNYIGKVTLTVYLEGWDHSLIDQELLHSFNMGLTFKTSRSSVADN